MIAFVRHVLHFATVSRSVNAEETTATLDVIHERYTLRGKIPLNS
ncbi:hypothetical protein [Enteractinococcus fodinae]|uniref:Uncharacterized protein n=1 Tax=Enteractinococcus fodinae TaxID=684663 RepID=A0ABU2B0Q4_9MICC|nr:hypothetical protein [Enteractinococcus fodinae]MDR7345954.1 hypothetical protein [Enteractinococcus fodinae]